jgi:excisionase family DNA binding protein
MLSVSETGKMLSVCTKTIHRWDAVGKIYTVRTPGNQRRIPATEIARLQGQNQSGSFWRSFCIADKLISKF